MATEVFMPQLGFDMRQGTVVRWLRKPGDTVTRGEPLLEVETDKAVVEVEAFASGVLRQIVVGEGQVAPVGQVIGLIAEPGEEVVPVVAAPTPAAEAAPLPAAAGPAAVEAPGAERLRASPLARRLAEEHSIDLNRLRGSGPGGRIVKEDVEKAIAERAAVAAPATAGAARAPAPAPRHVGAPAALSPMRQAIARRMAQSKREAPHFYLSMDIDMTESQRLRHRLNDVLSALRPEAGSRFRRETPTGSTFLKESESLTNPDFVGMGEGDHISINDMIVKATALALARFPYMNASYTETGVVRHQKINVGVAIALEDGLIAPAIVDCGAKSLAQIARESQDLAERAKGGKLKPEEYAGATFTVSNLGMYEVDTFIAIINPPQAAILAVGSVRPRPAVKDGQIVAAEMMTATLSSDHRVTDGAQAARFLAEVKRLLEHPVALLV